MLQEKQKPRRKAVRRDIPYFEPPDFLELVLEITITGQSPRKSNGRRIVINQKTKKPRSIKSEAAISYGTSFLQQVPGWSKLGLGSLTDPLFMLVEMYYTSMRPDVSVELVKDLLQAAGVVQDDRYIRAELVFGRVDADNPRAVIRLYRLREE